MKSVAQFVGAVAAVLVATCGAAIAGPALNPIPEPGSIALIGVAVAALVAFSRKGK